MARRNGAIDSLFAAVEKQEAGTSDLCIAYYFFGLYVPAFRVERQSELK